jgi:hypothetical protein
VSSNVYGDFRQNDRPEDPMGITLPQSAYLDLSSLVHRIRRKMAQRDKVPKHSGTAKSGVRRKNRLIRRRLLEEIEDLERQVVSWALLVIPVEDDDLDQSPPELPDEDLPVEETQNDETTE